MCFGCSKEPSHRDGSFVYTQHMFWLRNKKNNFQLSTLIWGLVTYVLILCFQKVHRLWQLWGGCSEEARAAYMPGVWPLVSSYL